MNGIFLEAAHEEFPKHSLGINSSLVLKCSCSSAFPLESGFLLVNSSLIFTLCKNTEIHCGVDFRDLGPVLYRYRSICVYSAVNPHKSGRYPLSFGSNPEV